MPAIPLVLISSALSPSEIISKTQPLLDQLPQQVDGVHIQKPTHPITKLSELILPDDPTEASRLLYSELRSSSEKNCDLIYFQIKPHHQSESWAPLMDRLTRAASLRL